MLNKFFDHIYCINLDRRADRWSRVSKRFSEHGIEVERVSADDWKLLGGTPTLGCNNSHYKIIKKAKEDGLNNVFIFEDDTCFKGSYEKNIMSFLYDIPREWDLIYLAATHVTPPIPVSVYKQKVTCAYATHSYGINKSMFDVFEELENKKLTEPLDVTMSRLHLQYNCFCPIVPLTYQEKGFSDIALCNMDYTFNV